MNNKILSIIISLVLYLGMLTVAFWMMMRAASDTHTED